MNDQHRKRMDFGTGARHQMSPEMMEAQRRLAEKMKADRAHRPSAPTNPARPRIKPQRPQPSPQRAPQARPNHAQSPARPAAPAPVQSKSAVARGPMTAPRSKARRHGTHTPVEPRGPQDTSKLETLEFDALDKLSPNTSPVVSQTTSPVPKKDAPDKSILGGKSPFINTVNVEKRPLSGHTVNKKKGLAPKSPRPQAYVPPNDNVPTVVNTKRKNRKSNIALAIAIFFTVILGAIVGTFVYLAFFQ